MNCPTWPSMAVATSANCSGVRSSPLGAVVVGIGSVMLDRSLRGFEAGEVVADEVLQRDRHLLPVERGLRVVVEEIEDRRVGHDAVVVEADARAAARLIGPAVAPAAGDEVRVTGPAEAVEVGEHAAFLVGFGALVARGGA